MTSTRQLPQIASSVLPPLDPARKAALIRQMAAHLFHVPVEELQSPTRCRAAAALARQVAMYVCHVSLGLSFSDIGQLFGRDRTTASHACKVIEDLRDQKEFDDLIARIERAISVLGIGVPAATSVWGA